MWFSIFFFFLPSFQNMSLDSPAVVAATLALATRESQREEFEDSLKGQWDIVQLLQVRFPHFFHFFFFSRFLEKLSSLGGLACSSV
jgi:hypothetical protein